jgi:flagellar basal body-associated protein FliL
MILSKNLHTNYKYISIIIVLAIFVLGGILYFWWSVKQEFLPVKFFQLKKIEKTNK